MVFKYLKGRIKGFLKIKFKVLRNAFLGAAVFSLVFLSGGYYSNLIQSLPAPTAKAMHDLPESTRIFDRNGELLYEAHGDVKRRVVPLEQIPEHLRQATVAIEDKNFYEHNGYEISAILRAAKVNIENLEIKQGASTLTQQLARTVFLNNEKVFSRKIKELFLATKIEERYSKDEILEMYLNTIPYGSNAYGISAASEIYFNKEVKDLSLMESTYLAALPKAPTDYSPFGPNAEVLHSRAGLVLEKMHELGFISKEEFDETVSQDRPEFKKMPVPIKAPHFVFLVLDILNKQMGEKAVRQGGFDVYTSIDMDLQRKAEKIVSEQGKKNEEKHGAANAALTAIDTRTGEILTMVGSRDFFRPVDGAVNVAIMPRQPGSSFKPYVYAAALSEKLNPSSLITDARTDFAYANNGVKYIPQNYTGSHYGQVTIRKALAGSLNIPAVKVLVDVGIDNAIDLAERLGISTLKDRKRFGPALALGGGEVTLLEHTAALGAFGNEGIKQELTAVLSVKDRDGNTVFQWQKKDGLKAVEAKAAYEISDILSDSGARQYIFGQAANLTIPGRKAAVKTGTTQNFRDAWTVGYVPGLSVGVWVGNNDNTMMKKGSDGSVVAAPIWKQFMVEAVKNRPAEDFRKPEGYKEVQIAVKAPAKPKENKQEDEMEEKKQDDIKLVKHEYEKREKEEMINKEKEEIKNPVEDIRLVVDPPQEMPIPVIRQGKKIKNERAVSSH
jgi:1A family penicillin-binding protein